MASTITASGIARSFSVWSIVSGGRWLSSARSSGPRPRTPFSSQPRWCASSWRTVRRDLRLEQLRVVPEVAQQRVPEDHDPVVEVVLRDRVTLIEAVGAAAGGRRRRRRPPRARARGGIRAAARRSPTRTSALKSSSSSSRRSIVVVVVVASSSASPHRPSSASSSARTTSRSKSSSDSGSRQPAEVHHRQHHGAADQHRAGARTPRSPCEQADGGSSR